MEYEKIHQWEQTVDAAETTPLTSGLPNDGAVGDVFTLPGSDGVVRQWLRVEIIAGSVGARWAYWAGWWEVDKASGIRRYGIGPHPQSHVIADKIFNGDAAHFVGMLAVPYGGRVVGVESSAWVLVNPKVQGTNIVHVAEDLGRERYEKSKEVFDVETGETRMLP